MDLKQRKLNRSEWTSIEVPVSASEIAILNLIMEGYDNVNIKVNTTLSILAFLKLDVSDKMEDYIYSKYLRARGDKIEAELAAFDDKYKKLKLSSDMKINSGQKLRLDRFDETSIKKYDLYEFTLLNHMESIVANKKIANHRLFHYHYYTLYKLDKNNVSKVNVLVKELVSRTLILFEKDIDMSIVLENAVDFIEKNDNLLKYSDLVLYEHQKEIFTICKHPKSKLILYMAPTGTGKTLTPIALSQQKKIIFVCAARHVGIALARAAISVKKRSHLPLDALVRMISDYTTLRQRNIPSIGELVGLERWIIALVQRLKL